MVDFVLCFFNDIGNYVMYYLGYDGKYKIWDIMLMKGWICLYIILKRLNCFE